MNFLKAFLVLCRVNQLLNIRRIIGIIVACNKHIYFVKQHRSPILQKFNLKVLSLINQIVTKIAKREFTRSLKFDEGILPQLPSCGDEKPRLLYLHIPFCEELCPYCSFHRITFEELLTRRYFQALRREIKIYQEKGYKFNAIYVGGGTPTILIDELAQTLNMAREIFPIQGISVETNPNHLISGNIEVLQQIGVKRLSVGVQTFNDDMLKKIGRYEKYGSGEEIAERLKTFREVLTL
jgi:coproporphyrinogen III oxidase-like Fe-S oxidoreductase